jgi:hypothetical protein
VPFQQCFAQRHRAEPVTVVAEEFHAPVLTITRVARSR